jgi:nucleoside-diphosphate-sugar epimerase
MKVLVTGGTGDVGRAAVERLVRSGHDVRVIGRRPGLAIAGADYRSCDIRDYAGLREQVRARDAIVHLAAVRGPSLASSEAIFDANCAGSFHVYQAAAEEGIRRVVSASSINALGYFYGISRFDLEYLPVDEGHPVCATDPYSFSKQVLEKTADYYWRREGISGTCLRLPWVYELTEERAATFRERYRWAAEWSARLLALAPAQQRAWIEGLQAKIDRFRAARGMERREEHARALGEEEWRFYSGFHNFWTTLDARDSAQAIERSLLAEYSGSYPLFVNDSLNTVGVPSRDLARLFYPEARRLGALDGEASLVSTVRARALIGFDPEHSMAAVVGHSPAL